MAAKPLRIAMVTTFYPPLNFGGDGQYIRRFAHALARRGCEIEIIHDADAWSVGSGGVPMPPVDPEPPGITVHRLQSRFPFLATTLTHQLSRPIMHGAEIKRLLARDIDVIHYHNASLVGGAGVLAIGDALKLYTAHEHWLVCPTHVLWRHNREVCDRRECLKCSLIHHRPPQLWRYTDVLDRAVQNVDVFIALSKSVAANHKAFGFKPPMTLLPSFMADADTVAAQIAEAPPPERPFFLFVGRLEIIKGLQDVIPVFDAAMPADLVIAGAGAYEPELRQLAEGRSNIKFIGQTGREDLTRLYRQARALLATSRCYEVFPMVMLEAFREGTPVIARDLGPYPEIIEESAGGLLFKTGYELRAALLHLLQNPDQRDQMGAAGRAALAERWSESVAMDGYFDLIQATAERTGRPEVATKAAALPRSVAKTSRPSPQAVIQS